MKSYSLSISTLLLFCATTVNSQHLMCFNCRSNPRHPRNCPVDGHAFSRYAASVSCKGSCYSRTSKFEPGVVHRGCSPNYKTGCHNYLGETWCYCKRYLCNIRNMERHISARSLSDFASAHNWEAGHIRAARLHDFYPAHNWEESEPMRCYKCHSNPRNPSMGCSFKGFSYEDPAPTVLCNGVCYSKTSRANPAIVQRGCYPEKLREAYGSMSGCQHYKGSSITCFCPNNLCNKHNMGSYVVQSMAIPCPHTMKWGSHPDNYHEDEHTNMFGTYARSISQRHLTRTLPRRGQIPLRLFPPLAKPSSRPLPPPGKRSSRIFKYLRGKFKSRRSRRDGSKRIRCYKCSSNPRNPYSSCPINGNKIKISVTTVFCKGFCYSKTNKANPAVVQRGCYPKKRKVQEHGHGFGCQKYKGDFRCFCDHTLCNKHNMGQYVVKSLGVTCSKPNYFRVRGRPFRKDYYEDEDTTGAGTHAQRRLTRALVRKTSSEVLKYLLGKLKTHKFKRAGMDESSPEDKYEDEAKLAIDLMSSIMSAIFSG